MNIYNKSSIIEYYTEHADSKDSLEAWYKEVSKQLWRSPADVKRYFSQAASILKNERVVFNVKGNSYRLIAEVKYSKARVMIRFIGTHAEYDQIDANTVQKY